MAEEILGNDFPLYDTQDADATEQNERGLRYTDVVLVERSSPMRWLLSGIVLQGLSLLLAEAKRKLCPMESTPFLHISFSLY